MPVAVYHLARQLAYPMLVERLRDLQVEMLARFVQWQHWTAAAARSLLIKR